MKENEIVCFPTQLCLGSISEKSDHVESEEVSFKRMLYDISVNFNAADKSDFLNIHKSLVVVKNNKIILRLKKQLFIVFFEF